MSESWDARWAQLTALHRKEARQRPDTLVFVDGLLQSPAAEGWPGEYSWTGDGEEMPVFKRPLRAGSTVGLVSVAGAKPRYFTVTAKSVAGGTKVQAREVTGR